MTCFPSGGLLQNWEAWRELTFTTWRTTCWNIYMLLIMTYKYNHAARHHSSLFLTNTNTNTCPLSSTACLTKPNCQRQKDFQSWSKSRLVLFGKRREIYRTTLTNPCRNFDIPSNKKLELFWKFIHFGGATRPILIHEEYKEYKEENNYTPLLLLRLAI